MSYSSAAIILYKQKKILLQLRDERAPTLKNTWALFGGGIEVGETALQAVMRECKEELSYSLKDPQEVFMRTKADGSHRYVYVEEYDEQQKLVLGEGAAMKWFSKKDVATINMITTYKELIMELYSQQLFE